MRVFTHSVSLHADGKEGTNLVELHQTAHFSRLGLLRSGVRSDSCLEFSSTLLGNSAADANAASAENLRAQATAALPES
jgi:hypothetical protein